MLRDRDMLLFVLSHFLIYSLTHSLIHLFIYLTTEKELERDKFMSPEEAKDFGLIDRVLSHPPSMEQTSSTDDKADS